MVYPSVYTDFSNINLDDLIIEEVQQSGKLLLQPNRWQLVALPVQNKKISDFIDYISSTTGLEASSLVEVANAYPSTNTISGQFLSYFPGVTNVLSTNNFSLVMSDNDVQEIVPFFIKTKNFDNDIEIVWDVDDIGVLNA